MTTTVVKTIGTASRDYSTLQAWEDACPADLVAVDQIWQGQCYNDSEFTGGLSVAGTTTDATRYKELTTAAGQSFSDNASVQTNSLRYNQANGVAINVAGAYSTAIAATDINFRMSKVQVKVSSDAYAYDNNTTSTSHVLDKCILQQAGSNGACIRLRGGTLSNSLLSKNSNGTSKAAITGAYGGATLTNCTIVRPNNYVVGGTAVAAGASFTFTLKNCAVFGFAADTSGTISATTCRTDDATPTAGFTTVAYDTSTGSGFQNTASATADFRIKSGSGLLNVGTTDTTYAATDIAGTVRPQGSAYDVGAWELVVAGGTSVTTAVGTVAITGYAPTIAQTANQAITPNVGNIVITGYTPTVSQPQAVNPGGGSIAIAGYSPTIAQTANQAITPDVGTITITGYAPTVQQAPASQNITPGVGTITITGYAPTVEQGTNVQEGVAGIERVIKKQKKGKRSGQSLKQWAKEDVYGSVIAAYREKSGLTPPEDIVDQITETVLAEKDIKVINSSNQEIENDLAWIEIQEKIKKIVDAIDTSFQEDEDLLLLAMME